MAYIVAIRLRRRNMWCTCNVTLLNFVVLLNIAFSIPYLTPRSIQGGANVIPKNRFASHKVRRASQSMCHVSSLPNVNVVVTLNFASHSCSENCTGPCVLPLSNANVVFTIPVCIPKDVPHSVLHESCGTSTQHEITILMFPSHIRR